jgi:hypothetical protein
MLRFPATGGSQVTVQPALFHRVMGAVPASGRQVVQEPNGLNVLLSGVQEGFADAALAISLRWELAIQGAIVPSASCACKPDIRGTSQSLSRSSRALILSCVPRAVAPPLRWSRIWMGTLTLVELRFKLNSLEETRKTVQRELALLASWRESLQTLERDKELILESHSTRTSEALDTLGPEERRTVYSILGLRVEALPDKGLRIRGAFGEENPVWEKERTSTR